MRRLIIGGAATIVAVGALAYFQRDAIAVALIKFDTSRQKVLSNQAIDWTATAALDASPDTASGDRPPNVILILADDLGINDISAFGGGVAGGRVPTPAIDALAQRGASFTQAYAGTASCAPSRAMILTGRYPTRTGFEFTPTPPGMGRIVSTLANSQRKTGPRVDWNRALAETVPEFDQQGLPSEEVTIAEVLKDRGYRTIHIGKWHLGSGPEFGPNAQGFDQSLVMASGLHLAEDDPNAVNAKLDFDPIDRFLWARMRFAASYNNSPWFEPGGYLADYWTDEAIAAIDAHRDTPFFLSLAHWAVHTPLQATREDYEAVGDIEPHRLRVYAAMVRALDRSVARIIEKLEADGILENTLIIFTSDNGGAGYIGLNDVNAPYRGWKLTFFEGGIRVPMFFHWPARIPAGITIDHPVAQIDLMPTIARAADAKIPESIAIDGVDLIDYMTTTADLAPPHSAIFWQSGYYRVVRQGDWKLQTTERPKKVWLFNLATDPTEQVNVAEDNPAKVGELQALIEQHQRGARAALYPFTIEAPTLVDRTMVEGYTPDDEYVYWPN